MKSPDWTREEILVAFYLYSQVPYSEAREDHPMIVKFSELLSRRTVGSVRAKLGNLYGTSPVAKSKGHKGLRNISKLDKIIWEEYEADPEGIISEAIEVVNRLNNRTSEGWIVDGHPFMVPIGEDKMALTKQRVRQDIFRGEVLRAYDGKCCISGISDRNVLNASHIKPWSVCNGEEKTSVRNGLCLNVLHDRLFDRGLITFDSGYEIMFSKKLKNALEDGMYHDYKKLIGDEGQMLHLRNVDECLRPNLEYLKYHRKEIFEKARGDETPFRT